jgi:DNA uptake protein ComE-like DNA-binding protein
MSSTYKGIPCTIRCEFDNGLIQIEVSGEVMTVNGKDVQSNNNKVVVIDNPTKPEQSTISLGDITKLNINNATLDEIAGLKGIGKVSARKIINNKPSNGYIDIEQLKSLNIELDRIDWDVVASQVIF